MNFFKRFKIFSFRNWERDHLEPDEKEPSLPSLSLSFILICIALTLLKLWLIHNEEIMARYMPYDQSWFINAADHLINLDWLGPYDKMTLIRQPGYPLWIWWVNLTGIPLRLATELLFLGSVFALTSSLIKAGLPLWLCVLLYLVMIFHPLTIASNNEVESETFYTPMLYLSISSMIMMSLYKSRGKAAFLYALLTGIFLSLLWNTRLENQYIAVILGSYGILELLVLWKQKKSPRIILKNFLIIIAIPSSIIFSSVLTIRAINFSHYGIFATSELLAEGFVAANKALLRIEANRPRRYVPVPQDVREKAYAISPTFKEIKPHLEGDIGKFWIREFSCAFNKMACDDIAGCFFWALRDSVDKAGYHTSALEADNFYGRLAKEINSACDKGDLKCRSIFNSFLGFLHPDTSVYLSSIPKSFLKVMKMLITPDPPDKETEPEMVISEIFDQVANRRTSIIPIRPIDLKKEIEITEPILIRGWVFSFEDAIVKIQVRNGKGEILGSTERFGDRPDVLTHLAKQGIQAPLQTGFSIRTNPEKNDYAGANLVFIKRNGTELRTPFREIQNSIHSIAHSIDAIGIYSPNQQTKIKIFLNKFYSYLIIFLGIFSLIALIIILINYGAVTITDNIYSIIILLTIIIGVRVLLVTMLDASAFNLDLKYIRYVFPVIPLYSCFIILIIYRGVQLMTKRIHLGKST